MEKLEKFQIVISCIVLSLGILFSSLIFASKISKNTNITTTGSASKIIKSDSGKLSFDIQSRATTQKEAYAIIKKHYPIVEKYLSDKGINKEAINIKTPNSYNTYKTNSHGYSTNEISHYNVSQNIEIKSNDVNKIKEISTDILNLIDSGVNLNVYQPEFYYSDLATIKIELLKEATQDAKKRATSMLEATGAKIGNVKSLRMGVFQITPVDSTMVTSMGINDTTTIDKKVTAVANIIFEVK